MEHDRTFAILNSLDFTLACIDTYVADINRFISDGAAIDIVIDTDEDEDETEDGNVDN